MKLAAALLSLFVLPVAEASDLAPSGLADAVAEILRTATNGTLELSKILAAWTVVSQCIDRLSKDLTLGHATEQHVGLLWVVLPNNPDVKKALGKALGSEDGP